MKRKFVVTMTAGTWLASALAGAQIRGRSAAASGDQHVISTQDSDMLRRTPLTQEAADRTEPEPDGHRRRNSGRHDKHGRAGKIDKNTQRFRSTQITGARCRRSERGIDQAVPGGHPAAQLRAKYALVAQAIGVTAATFAQLTMHLDADRPAARLRASSSQNQNQDRAEGCVALVPAPFRRAAPAHRRTSGPHFNRPLARRCVPGRAATMDALEPRAACPGPMLDSRYPNSQRFSW